MIRLIVCGAKGRMGSITVEKLRASRDFVLAGEVDLGDPLEGLQADVLVDFSHHTAAPHIMQWAAQNRVAVVMCTTGHTETERQCILSAAEKIPVFYSANMSIGIALLVQLAKKTAAAFPDADIEILETHHNRKADAPSGTALALGEAIRTVRPGAAFKLGRSGMDKRNAGEIGFHAIRRGNVPGIHEVIVSTDNQSISLKHEVYDRALFADGALAAAAFIAGKVPGMYEMQDLIG